LLLKKNIGFLELDLNKINLFSETIFKFDHDKISLQEAIKIIKENFIVTDTSDRRKKPIFVDNSSKISEIEEAFRTYNISKNELSKMIGCDASNLNKIIKFKIKPSVDIAKRIGDVLKIE
jgi:ribosome-binding protein aMBF1 (putative translation factor)